MKTDPQQAHRTADPVEAGKPGPPRLSWEPRHKFGKRGTGAIYCSLACGFDCTRAAYDEAVRLSTELATQMGPQWKPVVWENMGWYWSVESGPISIHYSKYKTGPSYSCLISATEDSPGGYGAWTPGNTSAKTARAALRKTLAAVRAHREFIVQAAARAELAAGLK